MPHGQDKVASDALWRDIRAYGPREDYGRTAFEGLSEAELKAKFERQRAEGVRRERFIVEYSFAIPTEPAIEAIRDFVGDQRLLEIGAGSGLWARLLHDAGVFVTATDDFSWQSAPDRQSKYEVALGRYYPVKQAVAVEAVQSHPGHEALLVCWPPHATSMATEATLAFRGEKLVYIGEEKAGLTADKAFFAMLAMQWRLEAIVPLPNWPPLHDSVFLYSRKLAG